MKKIMRLVWWGILLCCVLSCSGEDNPDGDIDSDTDAIESIAQDGDMDEELEPDCTDKECSDGRYCDPYDGMCKICINDSDCGLPDVISGVYPVCREDKCEEVVCPAVIEVTAPEDGFEIPSFPVVPTFSDKYIVVDNQILFPVAFQGLNPELYGEAKSAGANLVISTRECCANTQDLDYQKQYVLNMAKMNDLLAGVYAVWPWDEYDAYQMEVTEAMSSRYNITSTLLWVVSDRATSASALADVKPITDMILDYSAKKPLLIFEDSGYKASDYPDEIAIHVVDLDIDGGDPGQEILRLQTSMSSKSIWARLAIKNYSEEQLRAAAVHAIAYGARGIVIEIADEENKSPEGWETAKKVSRYIRDRTELWLEGSSNKMIEVKNAGKAGVYNAIYNGKVSIAYMANPSSDKQTVDLTMKNEDFPFCLGFAESNKYLQITNQQELTVELEPYQIKVLYMSEAAYTGD